MNEKLPVVHMIGSVLFLIAVYFSYTFGKALWAVG